MGTRKWEWRWGRVRQGNSESEVGVRTFVISVRFCFVVINNKVENKIAANVANDAKNILTIRQGSGKEARRWARHCIVMQPPRPPMPPTMKQCHLPPSTPVYYHLSNLPIYLPIHCHPPPSTVIAYTRSDVLAFQSLYNNPAINEDLSIVRPKP